MRLAHSVRLAERMALAAVLALPCTGCAYFFVGAEGGLAGAGGVTLTRTNHGVPTNCDQWLDAHDLDGDGMADVPLPAAGCAPRTLPASPNDLDLDFGYRAAVSTGWAFGPVRTALEYSRQARSGATSSLVVPGDPKQQEFVRRDEAADRLRTDSLLANVHWDIPADGRWQPYVGLGLGTTRVALDYAATSERTAERDALIALGRNPNAAGTVSRADATLADTLLGYEVSGGVRYDLDASGRRALDIRLRYGGFFDDFSNTGNRWQRLRDHDSTVAPGGAPVLYDIDAEGFAAWSLSLGLVWMLQ